MLYFSCLLPCLKNSFYFPSWRKKPFKTTHYLLWNYRAVGKLNILGVINNQRLFEKQCFALNVAVEVLFIEISLRCYPEDIFSSCKVWQLQRDEKISDIKNCLSCSKQKLAGLKTRGLVGLWATFEERFFLCFGGPNFNF